MKALLVGMGETGAIAAFLKKPITPETLIRKPREVLDSRRVESMAASGIRVSRVAQPGTLTRSWVLARSTA